MLAQLAAVFHLADHFVAASGKHAQRDLAVAQQNAVALVHRLGSAWNVVLTPSSVPDDVFGGDGESLAETKADRLALFECAGANFGSLQVGEKAIGFSCRAEARRRSATMRARSSCVPCEKFRRATSMPA